MNIAQNLEIAAYYFPKRIAVVDESQELNFEQFNREASRVASALARLGIQPGNHVGLCAPNSWRWLAFYFGVIKAGAVAVTFSHMLAALETDGIIGDCLPKAFFTTGDKIAALGGRRGKDGIKVVIGDGGDIDFNGLLEMGSAHFRTVDRNRHATAVILYTGGTTGVPKGALLSHENLQTSIHNVAHNERSTEKDLGLCFLPLNHVFAQIHIVNATIYKAGGIVLQPGFDLEKAIEAIVRRRITKFYAVPTIYIRLLTVKDLDRRFRSVRYCFSAAASMAAETVREWKTRTGLDIHESYGMTESASMVTYNHYYRHEIGSVGTPVSLVEVQVRDAAGKVLPPGDRGEICICGPNITRGYLNNPAETASAFWGKWFRSGDVGLFGGNGHLYIVDRLKDMIITGGENVYPREVEEVLYTRPDVLECAVIGLPDREYGERVTAFIIPRGGSEVKPEELKPFLKTQLAVFKVPKDFIAVDELPKNNTGKLLKRELRRQYRPGNSGKQNAF